MKRADIHTEHINNLILSFLNRTISSTDLKVLKEWIDENEDNKAYFSEIQKIWLISSIYEKKNFDKLKDRAFQQFKDRIAQKNQEQDIYISRPNWNRIFYIAACIIIAFFAGIGVMYFTGNQRLSDQTLSYSVESPRGSKLKLSLPDGTSVWLNADSKLRFPVSFTAERRYQQPRCHAMRRGILRGQQKQKSPVSGRIGRYKSRGLRDKIQCQKLSRRSEYQSRIVRRFGDAIRFS